MKTLTNADLKTYRGHFITVTQGIAGFFAVEMWWNSDLGGFWEPYESGLGRYRTRREAEAEARVWARNEGLPVYL